MQRTKRIAKRTAAILLCAVMLFHNIPYLPQASANIIPFPGGAGIDGTAALQIIQEYVDLNVGIGVGNVTKLRMMGPQAIAIQQTIDYLALRADVLAAKFGLTLPAVEALLPLLGLVGFGLVVTDWEAVYVRITDSEAFERWRVETENGFYNWAANYSNFPNLVAWITEQIGGGHTITEDVSTNQWYAEVTAEGWQIIKDNFKNVFGFGGSTPGLQEIPAIPAHQVLVNMMNATFVRETAQFYEYHLPIGVYFEAYNPVAISYRDQNNELQVRYEIALWRMETGYHASGNPMVGFYYDGPNGLPKGSASYTADTVPVLRIYKELKTEQVGTITWIYDAALTTAPWLSKDMMMFRKELIGIPATPYINNMPAIQEQLDRIEDKLANLVIEFPHLENPTGDLQFDLGKLIELLQDWVPMPNPDTDSNTDPGTDPGTQPDPDPDPDPELKTDPDPDPEDDPKDQDNSHFHLFPFCIPFDVVDMIKSLRQTPEAPRWEIPFALPRMLANFMGKGEEIIVVDLSFLEQIMPFVRLLILAGFVLLLAKATSNFIKW